MKGIYVKTINQDEQFFTDFDDLKAFIINDDNVRWNFDRAFNLDCIEEKFDAAWLEWALNGFNGRYNFYTAKMKLEEHRNESVASGNDPWVTQY